MFIIYYLFLLKGRYIRILEKFGYRNLVLNSIYMYMQLGVYNY